jgi:hypothetical protein
MTASGAEQVRAQALEVAAGWATPDAPPSWQLTAALFGVIAGHDALLRRMAALPPDRLPALLASAAIAFLIHRDRPQPLAGYFPEPGAAQPDFDDGFFPAARWRWWISAPGPASACTWTGTATGSAPWPAGRTPPG